MEEEYKIPGVVYSERSSSGGFGKDLEAPKEITERVGILVLQPGIWRELAEEISLSGAEPKTERDGGDDPLIHDGKLMLKAGVKINVLGEGRKFQSDEPQYPGKIEIKLDCGRGEPGHGHRYLFDRALLENVQVTLKGNSSKEDIQTRAKFEKYQKYMREI